MSSHRLKVTRAQLAAFLSDHETIKQFERLFSVADEVEPLSDTQGIGIQAGNAAALANAAMYEIQQTRKDADTNNAITHALALNALNLASNAERMARYGRVLQWLSIAR